MILVVSSLERLPIKTKNKLNNSSMGNLTEFQNNTVHSTDMQRVVKQTEKQPILQSQHIDVRKARHSDESLT